MASSVKRSRSGPSPAVAARDRTRAVLDKDGAFTRLEGRVRDIIRAAADQGELEVMVALHRPELGPYCPLRARLLERVLRSDGFEIEARALNLAGEARHSLKVSW